jgi:hypothetical protein
MSSSGTFTMGGSLTDGSDGSGSPSSPRKKLAKKRRARTMPEIIFEPRARTLSELQEGRDRVIYYYNSLKNICHKYGIRFLILLT